MAEPAKKDAKSEDSIFTDILSIIVDNIVGIILFALAVILFFINRELMLELIAFYFLLKIAFKVWMHYVQQDFKSGITWVIMEIVPPREVLRSPKAMELFFTNALYHHSNKGGLELYWQGAIWFWYSLEIVSIDGQVHFYIRTPSRIKDLIETQMYAQYPQAQVKVVDDYTLGVDKIVDDGEWKLWGCEFALARPEAYPIKTYVDYGLDKDPKEEYKIDPISPLIELFGSIKKGEQMWLQIVVRPSKKEFKSEDGKTTHDWVKQSEIELNKLLKSYAAPGPEDSIRPPGFAPNDPMVKGVMAKMTKIGFDTGIRACYVAKKEAWDMNHRRDIRLIFRQYANMPVNELVRVNSTQADSLAGGGFFGSFFLLAPEKVTILSNRMLKDYRNRGFFNGSLRKKVLRNFLFWPITPYLTMTFFESKTQVMNVEEIATLWHFPGQMLKVPTLERIESKEAAPPTNLPT